MDALQLFAVCYAVCFVAWVAWCHRAECRRNRNRPRLWEGE
jgi:hypothetical protein